MLTKIKVAQTRLAALAVETEDNASRTAAIRSHTKNVLQELSHSQALNSAKSRHIKTESHLKQLAEREAGKLNVEIRRIAGRVDEITDQLSSLQDTVQRETEKLDAAGKELKLERSELAEWLRVQTEKEEDFLVISKYSKEDDCKIKESSQTIEKLVNQVNKNKAALNAEVTETQVAQIELEKTTESFRQIHQERQELISKWDEAVKTMKKRDQDIIDAQDVLLQHKKKLETTQRVYQEHSAMHVDILNANAETEKKILLSEREVARFRYSNINTREEHTEASDSLNRFQNEIETLRVSLNQCTISIYYSFYRSFQ